MIFDPNPLFYEMVRLYHTKKPDDDKILIFNEGGSRSSKTWDFFHFLVFYCDQFRNQWQEIYCHRDTLTNCRDYTLKDFINCLTVMKVFDPSKLTGVGHKPYYNLFGNHIYFRGLDDENNMEGYPSDISFFNELLEVNNEAKIAGIKMRCRKLIVGDWNPKYTDHWAFNYEGRPNTYFTRTTFRNNKHCPPAVIKEILSYEPTEENIRNRTADDYRWNVYGLGLRSAPEGLIFQHVTFIQKFPTNIEKVYWGIDFGYTMSPTAIAKIGVDGNNLYAECVHYAPTPSSNELIPLLKQLCPDATLWADSADPGMIADCRRAGLKVFAVNKYPGSITHGISIEKQYKIHYVDSPATRKEQSNYKYRSIHGIQLDEPVDDFNHWHDAKRYAIISNLRRK